jgi:two-component system, chemotaxis family, chemotaxis protein CheY
MATILIVDDSETLREQIASDLLSAGYQVIEGVNGEDGLDKATHHPIDLVISDYNMPVMDGLTMCSHINAMQSKKIPIFLLTTQSRPDLKEEAKKAGVLAWIIKPYNKEKLLMVTHKICPPNP